MGDDQGAAGQQGRAVTLVFSDLKGSTALAERLDAETLRSLLTQYFDGMRAVFEPHGGFIAKIIGDAIVAVFDAAADPEGAALHAAQAALESLDALDVLNDRFEVAFGVRLQNRTGVASGNLAAGEVDQAGLDLDVLAGAVVGTAESLESGAPVGGVLVDGTTRLLLGGRAVTKDHEAVPRKGGTGSVDAWQLVSVERDAAAAMLAADGSGATAADGTPRENRRTVTIVFVDPKPTERSGAEITPEVTHAIMSRYIEVVRPILEGHGGTVEKFIGDAVMAVFGLPVRHEDDAERAVRAAADVQQALRALNQELDAASGVTFANPIGVNTGTVVAGEAVGGERLVTGDAVNVAARLEQTAAPGEVILGALTHHLAEGVIEVDALEPLVLKGKAEPVPAFRLVSVRHAGATARRHDLPLIGRDRELDALRTALTTAIDGSTATRITVIGDAGVGKSRIVHEFLAEAGQRAQVVRGTCLAYGDGITFWPLLQVLQGASGIVEEDDSTVAFAKLAAMVGDDPDVQQRLGSIAGLVATPYPVAEIVWALRRVVTHLSAAKPLVIVFDDIHWAEPTFLEVVEQVTAGLSARMLILCAARPSVLDDHAPFVESATAVTLEPLSAAQAERFLGLLLGGSSVAPAAVARIVRAAAGNPLFLEQLLSMLIDDGRLEHTDGGWRVHGDLDTIEVPATIEALLTARLDRLPQAARDTIGPASVIGRHFAVEALDHLLDPVLRPDLGGRLIELASRDLVVDEHTDLPSYRFQHQLIRDATYQGLLKQSRAVLHELFVGWAEGRNEDRDRSAEFDEILGYHLEQAYRCWRELGRVDDHAAALGAAGSGRLAGAGRRALARGDVHAAANLLTRAADLLPSDDADRPGILLQAANALHENGSFDRAIEAYDAAAAAGAAIGDDNADIAASIERVRLQYLIGRIEDADVVADELAAARSRINALGVLVPDAASRVWQLQLNLDIAACRWSAAQHAADEVISHAQAAGNDLLAVRTMPLLAFLAQKGPMPVPEATAVCEGILAVVAGDRRSTSLTQLELAILATMALDPDEGRRLCASTRSALGELGWEMQAALVSLASGPLELLVDEPGRAEAELRQDYETLDRLGERNFISLTAVLLAEAVYRQRRFAEAHELVTFRCGLAAPDDLAVQILGSSVGAKLAAREGEPDAIDRVDAAIALMAQTEDPSGMGDLLIDRAEVLHLTGRTEDAVAATEAAAQQYAAKSNRAGALRAERVRLAVSRGSDPLG